ncbi:MAG TPA: hypothetical protein PKU91_05870, partial [Phycisphaerales bacterium]|nr:hypothetical protein [Phycisphaerales bacterium]
GVRARKADPQGRSPKSTAEEYFGEFDQPGAQGDEGGAADGRESEGRAPGTSHGKPATRSGSKTSAKAPGGKKSTRRSPATSSALADPQDPHHPDGSLDPEDEIDADAYFAAMELEGMGDDIDDEDEDEAP